MRIILCNFVRRDCKKSVHILQQMYANGHSTM